MNINEKHIKTKRKIGSIHGKPVVEVVTGGGFHMVATQGEGNKLKILGTGPHRAVARWIAQKTEPDLEITELSKSDTLDIHAIGPEIARWERITKMFQEAE